MSIRKKFFDHPIGCISALFLFVLVMAVIFGCTPEEFLTRVDDVSGKVDQVNASVDAIQLVVSSNIEFVKNSIYTLLAGSLGAGGLAGVNKYRKSNGG